MDYVKDILSRLLDMYERRGAFAKESSSLRSIQMEVKKEYPSYGDRYNHETYRDINVAIERLCTDNLVVASSSSSGQYLKVKLNISAIAQCYQRLKRQSVPEKCERLLNTLSAYDHCDNPLIKAIIADWRGLLYEYKKLPYDLKYDDKRVGAVLEVILAIVKISRETYIRNFSTALFKDSKKFQREFKPCIESILFDYTDEVVEKDQILEFYNLYENPTYVLIKGSVHINFTRSVIDVAEMPDGIALSNASLEHIKSISVKASRVITVENLTTYHDADDEDAVHIYLGGYHNHSKQKLLEMIYAENKNCLYFHKGDLDVYGFLILENLKEKTAIPFSPLQMDTVTLAKFYDAGFYKELTKAEVGIIKKKISSSLCLYAEVLQFMLDHNCKVEQESIKATELMGCVVK